MSTLTVEICKIEDVTPHPNADRLEICKLENLDWNCVIGKDSFTVGDLALYFPIDSILPEKIESLIFGKDAKVKLDKHRVRTIKLRKIISQGLVIKPEVVNIYNYKLGQDFTSELGIIKYEPPDELPNAYGSCNKVKKMYINSNFNKYTDIQNIKNHPSVFEDGEEVYISCKLHGTSFRAGWVENEANTYWKKVKKFFGLLPKWGFIVGSRNIQLTYGNKDKTFYKENVYTKTAEVLDLKSKLKFGEVLYGEVVGCFHYNTPILLSTGKNEKIGLLYNKFKNGEDIFVNSYNFEKEKTELKKVVGFTKNKAKKEDWITFEYKRRKRGGRACHIVTTKNHLFFTKYFKEIEADKLQIGDTIYLPSNKTLSFTQEQMILGSILGDASFSNNIYLVAHSEKQIEYLKFKQAILENFTIREFETISGHGSKMLGFSTCSLYDKITYDIKNILYTNNIKEPTKEYLEKLSPIAWAFWYMDDGSLHKTDGKQPISTISTLGFSEKSVDVIVEYFNIKSIFCFKIPIIQSSNGNKQYKLQFSAEGTKRFQALIAPYIHKSMSYKLLDCYKNIINSIDLKSIIKQDFGLIETIITSKNSGSFFKDTNCSKYDLEVEGNHNYFANNVLVHNSGIQKGYNYACSPGITAFYAYDVMIDNKWLDYEDFKNFCEERGIRPVPLLYIGPYSKEIVKEYTKGASTIDSIGTPIREGAVIKPLKERNNPYCGRTVLKSINEEYLLLKDNSDFH